jgi:septum site-determining protein MinD
MAHIISIHSFRGGTGKTSLVANLATLLAAADYRVGVVDTNLQSPGIHLLFGQPGGSLLPTLNDYLWRGGPISEAAHDITPKTISQGKIYLVPCSADAGDITRILRECYDARDLVRGLNDLVEQLHLDVLLIDTHPGLNEETLLSIAISTTLALVLRPDAQDYEGTEITLQAVRDLNVPELVLIANKVPAVLDADTLRASLEATYALPVAALLPHSEEMLLLASNDLFVLRYPDHPLTLQLQQVARCLLPGL